MVPQGDLIYIVKICRDADPNSWTWWLNMCWLYGFSTANAIHAGLSAAAAIGAAKLLRWVTGGAR